MSLRSAMIGVAVSTAMILVGALVVGGGASDAEIELICYPAIGVGFVIVMVLEERASRRRREQRSSR